MRIAMKMDIKLFVRIVAACDMIRNIPGIFD